jgi:hypothetical protein
MVTTAWTYGCGDDAPLTPVVIRTSQSCASWQRAERCAHVAIRKSLLDDGFFLQVAGSASELENEMRALRTRTANLQPAEGENRSCLLRLPAWQKPRRENCKPGRGRLVRRG